MDEISHKGHRQRFRERILKTGFDSLFPHELLEFILFGCFPQRDTNLLAHKLIAAFGSLDNVLAASTEELKNVKGINDAAALQIKSYTYVAKMINSPKTESAISLTSLGKIRNFLDTFFRTKVREEFHVLLVDGSYTLMRHIVMTSPIMSAVYVDMDEVMKAIASLKPSAVIFAHNHPSGVPLPSKQDIEFTQRYFYALRLSFNISVCEHMIFGKDGSCYSFRNGGELEKIKHSFEASTNSVLNDGFELGGLDE